MNLYEGIKSKLNESDFGIDFEKNIPHRMRFKHYDFVSTYDDYGREKGQSLYWVTQEPFDDLDLEQFRDAFVDTPYSDAYVTVRDLSSYDFNSDKDDGVLVHITKDGTIDSDSYMKIANENGWFNEADSPVIKLSDTYKVIDVPKGSITATPSIVREINNARPLDKEKYGVLMNALDDIITDIGSNKAQLKDLRDEVASEFNRALDFKESEKLKMSESDLGDKVFTFGGEGSGFGAMEEEDLAYWKKELKKRHIKIKDIDDDLTFTVEGKLKDIYDFYNKVVDSGSLGMDYNNMEEFAEWSGLL